MDHGTAYGRLRHLHDPELTEVGPGKPCGELLRRFWQPIALATEVTDVPKEVRILGEDLILFRDGRGRYGLLEPRCCHRGTSLYYGKVETTGVRCCYHGWLFDTEGRCLEQPCEPANSTFKNKVRQPWYPVHEYQGLIFAYMGPADAKPAFPLFDLIEETAANPDETIIADGSGYGLGGGRVLPCNWLQIFENVMDPFHVFVLHSNLSGLQFTKAMAKLPAVEWHMTEFGVRTTQDRTMDDGSTFRRITECFMPNIRLVPHIGAGTDAEGYRRGGHLGWVVPIDDTHTTMFSLLPVRRDDDGTPIFPPRAKFGGKSWEDLTAEEHQRQPGDQEAQVGQGPIADHSSEHLGFSDQGVIMIRRRLKELLGSVEHGFEPEGVSHVAQVTNISTIAGNYLLT